ncbi:MAG TPA: biotin transporter BioY [candidate division WOR-3 bacterium]|uniref:Biotin transporter n=1 Tax=candidate division WOR-3 bacterium TaxID=2052148 RepID=A0A9C9JZZ2_UNCW3|nr:biotin transporter BioY [candidate division WOR-3 bacterium]
MNLSRTINYWETKKAAYYQWMYGLSRAKRLFLCLGMAAVTGLSAQIRIPLSFTPVPITGQVFVVLLTGVLLGNFYGGFAMFLYFIIGCAGFPWFTGATGGLPLGPTAGYILGFIPAALVIGWMTEKYKRSHGLLPLIGLMMIGVLIIYLCGAVYFALFMKTTVKQTLIMAVLPFIPVDLFKALAAAAAAKSVLPRS